MLLRGTPPPFTVKKEHPRDVVLDIRPMLMSKL
jgi:hypothetical protein